MSTLSGHTLTAARVQLPKDGIWWADAEIDQPVVLTGAVTLVLADQSYQGTVMSGGPVKGRSRYRIAGGAGGWGRVIPARHYANDAGVKYATILSDAAADAGETIADIPVGSPGVAWTRESGPASWQLEALFPSGW